MHLSALIIDSPLRFSPPGENYSVLALPLGCRLVIDHLVAALAPVAHGRILVMPAGGGSPGEMRLGQGEHLELTQFVDRQALQRILATSETSDFLIIVEPRYWPRAGYDFSAVLRRSGEYRGATHAIAVGSDPGAIRERVLCDADGQIRGVQRVYRNMTWPDTAEAPIVCSVLPAQLCPPHLGTLTQLRTSLLARDCFTQDLAVPLDVDDLSSAAGLLAATEHLLARLNGNAPGFRVSRKGVRLSETSRVHPAARLIPPAVVHPDAELEEGVTVIGPAVLGPHCRIRRGALVARSVIGAEVEIPPEATVSHQAVLGRWAPDRSGTGDITESHESYEHSAWHSSDEQPIGKPVQLAVKRAIDFCLALAGLMLLSPLLIAVAVLVKLTSPGPVFFAHSREGRNGREFHCLKFRTMVADAHRRQRELYTKNEVDGPQFKLADDPRVTLLGEWLRETNIDELPQLLNVLRGEMSLVGPRPSPFRENQICVPWRRARLAVRPGITGLWQLCRERRCDSDFNQWIYYDLLYVKHLSLWLDAKILWHTLVSIGGRRHVPVSRIVPRTHGDEPEHDPAIEQPWLV